MKRLILAVFVLLSVSCIPYSDNPLSDQSREALDSALVGTWYWNEKSDSGFVHIGKDSDEKTLLITMVEFKNDGRVETSEFTAFTSKLSSHRFLNLKWARPRESEGGYFFMKYVVTADVLECSFPDQGFIADAVQAGALQGKVLSPGELAPAIRIHARQDELRKFFLKNDKVLFKNSSKLKKLTLPKQQAEKS